MSRDDDPEDVAWVFPGVPLWEALDLEVTRAEAIAEIDRHDVEGGSAAFLAVGDKPEYIGSEVLDWLGY